MAEQPQTERYRIYEYMTKTRWLHIEDSLDGIGKVRLYAGEYKKGHGSSANAHHFMDLDDARVVFSDLAWGKRVEHREFKGSNTSDGAISRVLSVKSAENGQIWFSFEHKPGKVGPTGAIMPAGETIKEVNVPISIEDGRKIGMAVLAHIAAWEAATFHQRVGGQQPAQVLPQKSAPEPGSELDEYFPREAAPPSPTGLPAWAQDLRDQCDVGPGSSDPVSSGGAASLLAHIRRKIGALPNADPGQDRARNFLRTLFGCEPEELTQKMYNLVVNLNGDLAARVEELEQIGR